MAAVDHLLDVPVHARSDRARVGTALARLGCEPSPAFRFFFERHAGPFGSPHTGFTLLDLVDQDVNIVTQTEMARTATGLPARCLVLSDMLGHAVLVYDCLTDAVFSVDFEGSDAELIAGTLTPRWTSFAGFLAAYFLGMDD